MQAMHVPKHDTLNEPWNTSLESQDYLTTLKNIPYRQQHISKTQQLYLVIFEPRTSEKLSIQGLRKNLRQSRGLALGDKALPCLGRVGLQLQL